MEVESISVDFDDTPEVVTTNERSRFAGPSISLVRVDVRMTLSRDEWRRFKAWMDGDELEERRPQLESGRKAFVARQRALPSGPIDGELMSKKRGSDE